MPSRTSRSALIGAVALTVAAGVVVPASVPASAGTTSVTIVSGSIEAPESASISDDGRWVVYGGTDVEGRRTVYRSDVDAGVTEELSPVPDGIRAGDTILPSISADGCVVVALTEIAFDLFRDDDRDDRWDVYRLVTPECGGQSNAWELISQAAGSGSALDGVPTDDPPAVSGSGAVVAYVHQLSGAPAGVTTISLVDTQLVPDDPGRVVPVAGMPFEAPNGVYQYRGARQPVLSQNGRHLAFVSDTTASAPLPGWGTGPEEGGLATSQVFVWDRGGDGRESSVRLLSGNADGPSVAGADSPTISEDGRAIAFRSSDRALVSAVLPPCDVDCPTQIYRFDRDTDRNGIFDEPSDVDPLSIVSAVDAGAVSSGVPTAGDGSSNAPAMNADGTQVAFVTDATNLLPTTRGGGGAVGDGDLLVAEVVLGQLRRVLDGPDFASVAGAHDRPTLSATGQRLAFETDAAGAIGDVVGVGAEGRAIVAVDVAPQLSLAQLDFGAVLVGLESAELYASVRNAGPGAFAPGEVEASENFEVTGGTCVRGVIVSAGTSCSIEVTFTPTAPQDYTGTVTVRGVDGTEVSTEVRGTAGAPMLLVTPGGVDLDQGSVGRPGDRVAFDVENVGFVPVEITAIDLTGEHPDDFQILSQSCLDRFLNPGAICTVEVQMVPTSDGYRSALAVVRTAGGSHTAAVLGGFARFEPELAIASPPAGGYRAGGPVGVGGDGFPPGAEVVISFGDGTGILATTTADDAGEIRVRVDLPGRARPGERRLVASADNDAGASAPIVIEASRRPPRNRVPGFGLG